MIWLRSQFPDPKQFQALLRLTLTLGLSVCGLAAVFGLATGYISPWTGRFYSLLDPTYAKDHIPIIASVSEHQPTTWSSFFFDYHLLMLLFPAGKLVHPYIDTFWPTFLRTRFTPFSLLRSQ